MIDVEGWWVPKIRGAYVSYLRQSHLPHSRLRISDQRADVAELLSQGQGFSRQVDEFIEHEPLIAGERPALEQAIALCKARNAKLVIGKIDRMRGRFSWFERLYNDGVYFIGADVPEINRGNFLKLAHEERNRRQAVSGKVRHALAEASSRGVVLGGRRENSQGLKLGPAASAVSRQWRARSRAWATMHKIRLLRHRGITSLTGIATRLNQMGHTAPRGGKWSPAQVRRVINECED